MVEELEQLQFLLLGGIVKNTFGKKSAGLIGVRLLSAGLGYKSAPFVEIKDTCNKGYGLLQGQLSIMILSHQHINKLLMSML